MILEYVIYHYPNDQIFYLEGDDQLKSHYITRFVSCLNPVDPKSEPRQ